MTRALKIDFSTYEVFVRSKPVKLTLKEFELLRFPGPESQSRAEPRSASRSRVGEERPSLLRERLTFTSAVSEKRWRRMTEAEVDPHGSRVGYKFDEKALE